MDYALSVDQNLPSFPVVCPDGYAQYAVVDYLLIHPIAHAKDSQSIRLPVL